MFNNFFGKKLSVKEQQRDNDKNLRKASREIDRERRKLEEEEKKLEQEIKRNAQAGNNDVCKILAKQLIEVRKQKSRTFVANSKITSIGFQNKNIGANIVLTNAMSTTSKTVSEMNKIIRPETIGNTVREFQQANMRMEMTEEMINDTLDDMLTESGDEEESNAVVDKVLDEIGIEISGKMATIPSTGSDFEKSVISEKDIAAQLARLRSS